MATITIEAGGPRTEFGQVVADNVRAARAQVGGDEQVLQRYDQVMDVAVDALVSLVDLLGREDEHVRATITGKLRGDRTLESITVQFRTVVPDPAAVADPAAADVSPESGSTFLSGTAADPDDLSPAAEGHDDGPPPPTT